MQVAEARPGGGFAQQLDGVRLIRRDGERDCLQHFKWEAADLAGHAPRPAGGRRVAKSKLRAAKAGTIYYGRVVRDGADVSVDEELFYHHFALVNGQIESVSRMHRGGEKDDSADEFLWVFTSVPTT
jgi:hypothetical protein